MRLGILKDVDDSESYLFVQIKLIWLYLNTDMCFWVVFFCFFSISLFALVFLEMLLNSD